jgi:inner membrane protein
LPSSIGHAVAALSVGAAVKPGVATRRYWVAIAACAVVLDVDAIGRPLGRGDISWLWGHRALTHSLIFAVVLAILVLVTFFHARRWHGARARVFAALVLGTATHGVLDMLASYGDGVMLLAPFSAERFEFPWQPFGGILVEMLVIWMPGWFILRRRMRTDS